MPKKSGKSKSKRLTLRAKHKIIKKVKEHHKKKRKELKNIEKLGKGKKKTLKDPGIPSQWPFKDELIQELQARRLDILAKEQAKKDEKKAAQLARRNGPVAPAGDEEMQEDEAGALNAMANKASRQADEFALRGAEAAGPSGGAAMVYSDRDNSRRAFYKEFKKVVELSDVIIEVLDARDPVACRCSEVERYVRSVSPDKKIILLLNKIDLVPREVVEQWLKYFREELPSVAFKCSTQKQDVRGAAGGAGGHRKSTLSDGATQGSESLGAETLLQLLKNYARNKDIKTSITVGIVGLPNVGKSSLINSLVRTRAVSVGNMPGVTKALQEVHLDKNVKLLDSPGIVFTTAENEGAAALRNCLKVERLEDPLPPVAEIMKRVPVAKLMALYKLPAFQTAEQFLSLVAKTRGKLNRGGTPDMLSAARVVISDWNNGKIPYYTLPPKRSDGKHESAAIVTTWGSEFDAAAVFAQERSAVIAGLPGLDEGDFVKTEGLGVVAADLAALERARETGKDLDLALDELIQAERATTGGASGAHRAVGDHQTRVLYSEPGMYNPKKAKAEKKRAKKAGLQDMMDEDEEYDFAEGFEGVADAAGSEEEEDDEESGEEEDEEEDMDGSDEEDEDDD